MTTITTLSEAVDELVHDGDTLALEGFTHLIPVAAGQEIIRQGRRDLTVVTDDTGHRLRPDDRCRMRAQADLLVGWQSRRRLAAPLPRRHRERLAAAIGDRGAQPRRDGQPLRRRSRWAAVRRAARLPRHRPRRAHGDAGADHLPVHRRGADRRAGDQPGRVDRPCPAGRHHRQRDALGDHRRAEGGRAGGAAGAGHRRGDRRRAGTPPRCRRHPVVGRVARRRRSRRRPPELRPRLLDTRQRLLPRVGHDLVRPPALHRLAGDATSSVPRR